MKKKLQCREVRIDLFESCILVFWDCTRIECAEYIKKNFLGISEKITNWLEDEENECNGVFLNETGESANGVMWLSENPHGNGAALLAHEVTHASHTLMRHWSIEIDKHTEELQAMIVGTIVSKVMGDKKLTKHKK